MDSDEINLNMNEKGTFLRSKLISVWSTFLSKHMITSTTKTQISDQDIFWLV